MRYKRRSLRFFGESVAVSDTSIPYTNNRLNEGKDLRKDSTDIQGTAGVLYVRIIRCAENAQVPLTTIAVPDLCKDFLNLNGY